MERSSEDFTTAISKGDKVLFSSGLWTCLADVRRAVSDYCLLSPYKPKSNVIEGTVAWIGKIEEEELVAIQTDEPVFQGHTVDGIPKDHGILLPSHLVIAIQSSVKDQQKPCYEMTCQPHGLALVIADTRSMPHKVHPQAYSFLKIFEHMNYSVQHYTFGDVDQLKDIALQVMSFDHTSFDSFVCYISLSHDTLACIIEVLDIIQRCCTLENKPKMFFIKTNFPIHPSSIPMSNFQDSFLMVAQERDGSQFETIFHTIFKHYSHNDLQSMATNASIVKCMTGSQDADYTIISQLEGPVYFFNDSYDAFGDMKHGILIAQVLDDKILKNVTITTRCSYVSVIGPPNSGRSLVMKMLRDEPMLMNAHTTSMIFRPEIKATSLVALDHCDLSQPFENLSAKLLLSAAKNKVQNSANSTHSNSRSLTRRMMKRPLRKQQQAMHLIHVVNSGGHPFFLDLFAHLLKHHSFNIVTHKLSEMLDDEIFFRCSINGQIFNSPRNQPPMSSYMYIKELARSLTDMSLHENPSLLVLGTFVENLTESIHQGESIQERSEKIQELLEHFRGLSQIYTENELIFTIDAMMRSGRQEPAAWVIRQKICKSYVETEIPIRWFLFQLKLVKHYKVTGESVVHIKFCYETGSQLELDEDEVNKALECFCNMTIFLYFRDVLPEVVFLHPQLILDKLSEIWCLSDPTIVEQLQKNRAIFPHTQKQLQLKGLLEQDLVVQHLTDGFSDLFTAENFLKITNHLSIITFLPDNKLFFPKVLPEADIDNVPFTQSEVIPIIFNWDKKLIPKSFYIKLIQQLLLRHSFPIFSFLDSSETQYRNAIYLKNSEIGGAVVIVDAVKWLEVHYTGPPQGRKCHLIKSVIFESISNLLKLNEYRAFKFDELQTCFFCNHCPDSRDHFCVLSKDNKTLTCCSDGVSTWPNLNDRQRLWFAENVSDDSVLTARALADGSVNITLTKFLIFGPPKSGKSSAIKLLSNEDPERSRTSRFHVSQNSKDSSPMRTTLMISEQNEDTGDVTWNSLDNIEFKLQDLNNKDIHLVLSVESGGDATFLDIAPFLIGPATVTLYTQPLDVRFDDTTKFYYDINNTVVEEPDEFQISHLHLFQTTLRCLLAPNFFKQDIGKDKGNKSLKVLVIGTRDDLQVKVFRRTIGESALDKSQIIQSQCHEYASKIIKYREDRDKTIFPVNNISREERSLEIASRLRKLISKQNIKFRIPLSWCQIFLKLQELSTKNDIIETRKCIETGQSSCGMDPDSVIAALKYCSDKAIFLFFPAILPEVVFLQPQIILRKLSELVSLGFPKIASLLYRDLPPKAHENMSKYGIFDRSLLSNFLWKDVPGIFTIDGFLTLMEQWSIIAPLGHDHFFLLRALPTARRHVVTSLRESLKTNTATLVINWDSPFPRELFLSIFIWLIHREVAPYFEYIQSYDVQQFRNALHLRCGPEGGNILIVDASNWLEISYAGVTEKCRAIRDAIDLAIKDAFKQYGFERSYRICFFCDEHKEDEEHLSFLNEETNLMTCSKSMVHSPVNEKQKYWLKPTFDYNKRPQVADLMRIFYPFSTYWYEIGLNLLVPDHALQRIQHRAMSSKMKMSLVLQEWEKTSHKSPITWQVILDMVSCEPINKPSLRHEIEVMAEKSIAAALKEELTRGQQQWKAVMTDVQAGSEISSELGEHSSLPSFEKSSGLTDRHLRSVARLIQPDMVEELFAYLDMEQDYREIQMHSHRHMLMVFKLLRQWTQKAGEGAKEELISVLEDMECTEAKEWLERH